MKLALQAVMVCLAIAALAQGWRFVNRRSRLAGLMFAVGLAIRMAGAAFFLSVSYFELPVLTSLQMGGGFWTLASDAQEYYRLGGLVAEQLRETITPGYVTPLGLWMRVVGVNPSSPLLFALVMYALAVVTIVAAFGGSLSRGAQRALHLAVAALSFTPMLVYAGIFGLKDVYFTALIVVLTVAHLTLLGAVWRRATLGRNLLAAAAVLLGIWMIAATRAYFSILLWAAIGVTYAGCAIAGRPSRRRAIAHAAVVLPALAIVISLGSEGNYPYFVRKVLASIPVALVERRPAEANAGLAELDHRRKAIDQYGGNSMLSRRADRRRAATGDSAADPAVDPASAAPAAAAPAESGLSTSGRLEGLAVGLGAVFIPSSALEPLAGLDLEIGRIARLVADVDTVAFDLTLVVIVWAIVVNRRQAAPVPLLYGVALAVLVALPLAYVMTNFGTLIRLRLMVAAPIWLLTLALAPGFAERRAPVVPAPSQSRSGTSAPSDGH